MKTKAFSILLLTFVILYFLSGCQAAKPAFSLIAPTYNFGTIEEGTIINHTFEYTNSGTDTLVVNGVKPTCGCTIAQDYDKEVKPGRTGKVSLSLNSSGFDGYIAKSIIVKTNVPGNPDAILTLEGTVRESVNVSPKKLSFGTIERNRTAPLEGKISIANRLPGPMKITDVIKASDKITIPNVTLSNENVETKLETVKAGFMYSLAITVKPPFKHGEVMGTIIIKTDSKVLPEINTQYSYYVEPLVKIFPNPLFVTRDAITQGEGQLINVVCEPGYDMNIAELSVNITKVKASIEEVEQGRSYTIVLNIPKDFKFDPANTLMIKFRTKNVPDEPVFGVPVLEMR
jgi:hypothetical protein